MGDRCCHHCQDVLDALEELRISRLMHAMRPYLPSSPLPRPRRDLRGDPKHVVPLWPVQADRAPSQRSKTAAAQEDRLNLLPGYRPARTDVNNNRGF